MNDSVVGGFVLLAVGGLMAVVGYLVRYRGRVDLLTSLSRRLVDDPVGFGRVTGGIVLLYGLFVAVLGAATTVLSLPESATATPLLVVTGALVAVVVYAHWRY